MAYTDLKKRLIYDCVSLPVLLAGFLYSVYTGEYITALLGSAAAFFTLFAAAWVTNGGVGGGDIKLGAGIGMWLGYPQVIVVVLAACAVAVICELLIKCHQGRIRKVADERLHPFVQRLFMRYVYRVSSVDLSIPEEAQSDDIPLGFFLVMGAWLIYLSEIFGKGGM
ncbi:MAG: prepilin peptidase [Syntrophomonadaceae bacterium]|jgi:Flp pilus assembly protein protease CpaA